MSQLGDIKLSTVIPPTIIKPPEEEDTVFDPITCGIRSSITVVSFGGSRQLEKLGAYALRADVRDPDDILIPCSMLCVSGDTYLCQFRPQIPGNHILNVKLGGHHISMSPLSFRVSSSNPVWTTKTEDGQDGNGNLVNPIGVVVDHRGDIYVTDRDQNNSRVVQYDPSLVYQSEFTLPFGDIYDIAVDRQGRLIISEHNNNTVHIYTNQGKEEGKIENRDLKKPCGVAVNRNDDVVVADSQVKCVFVFSQKKKLLQKIGVPGTEEKQLENPTFLAVEPDNFSTVYVSDTGNNKIVVYNRKGVYESQIAAGDLKRGKLSNPKGVARDRHSHVLVCDEMNQVMVFTHEGAFVACIDSGGDQLSNPHGIATTNDGHVVVADTGNKCVKKYRYL
ncbi:tripartite motif-containing protein 2-like [Ptychodera flava]|uniref:tripartite motif-containing protein 2-like n=1 Tax=Ptychodera flava TaxID=63121 RepID=UPI00396A1A8B